jgi:hypothetical protein
MVRGYCYRVCFEDGGDETTNYVGAVLQVGDTIASKASTGSLRTPKS